jgi:hypothetical protein
MARQKTKDYTNELTEIYNFVNDYFRVDIAEKNRSNHYVDLRALYYKLATENTYATVQSIGALVNRDHSTVLHARRHSFDYIMSIKDLRCAYNKYMNIEEPLEASEVKLPTGEESSLKLTKNEIAYRKLSLDQRNMYDERVELILKSFNWKEYNTTFETINVGISSN